MLEVKNISYRYHNHSQLLNNVNLSINRGEIVGLNGKSGAGKTTLAQIVAGYKNPLTGSIHIKDKTICKQAPSPIQLIWQHPENVLNPRWKMKKVLKEAGQLDQEIIQLLGIRHEWLHRFPHELSGGELQRFCIARAFIPTTRYIIADEITTMLDAVNQAHIWHAILTIVTKRNIGMLAISHDLHLLRRISDHIIHFEKLGN